MKNTLKYNLLVTIASVVCICIFANGCGSSGMEGYTHQWLYPEDVSTVYVKMFDNKGFRRGQEYVLTDAICKRIESQTPYKIVSDMDRADTLLSGQVGSIGSSVLSTDRYSGRPLGYEVYADVVVTWTNLKTGQVLVNNETVSASSSYSSQLGQDFEYASNVAMNKAAQRVVELMETEW
ncbi:MAG: hypothetical protein KAJ07_06935 [Planctomycetes bacterium]|nr:hypothetical protein [Planctomycetota bacterium]